MVQNSTREYQEFAAQYSFKLTTSSPYHPKGHGFIQRQVQIIKNLLCKCAKDCSDHYLALIQLRSTTPDSRTHSPGGLLQNRESGPTLPVNSRPPAKSEAVRAALHSRQVYISHDAHVKEQSKLLSTQPVWVKNTPTKGMGKGCDQVQCWTPRYYIIFCKHHKMRKGEIGYTSERHQYQQKLCLECHMENM